MGKSGNIGSSKVSEREALTSISDWSDHIPLSISGEAGNVVISTKYAGNVCKGFANIGAASGAVVFSTKKHPTTQITFPLDVGAFSGKLAEIHTIFKTGTSDSILLYFQEL